MACSRVCGVLAIALCLLVCTSANTQTTELDAFKAVRWSRANTQKWLKAIKQQYNKAEALLNELTTYKESAENAALDAEKTAQMYPKVQATAAKVKTASDKALKHVELARVKATAAFQITEKNYKEFKAFYDKTMLKSFAEDPNNDYGAVKYRADKFTVDIVKKGTEMESEAVILISAAAFAMKSIPEKVETTLLANYQVDGIAAVAKIETLLEGADNKILIMEKTTDEVETTAKGIYKLYTQASENLKVYIFSSYYTTVIDLNSATSTIEKAKGLQKEMLKQKQEADDALKKVKTAIKTEDAKRDAATAAEAANGAEKQWEEITKKVEEVKTTAADAFSRKKNILDLFRKNNIVISSEDSSQEDPSAEGSTDEPRDRETDPHEWDSAKSPINSGTMSVIGAGRISAMSVALKLVLALLTCAALH